MTCIIGYVDEGVVYIGGDSASVSGLDMMVREDSKVFRKGKMIFGFAGSFRMGQLLRYSLKIPNQTSEQSDFGYLCTSFISAVKNCFKDNEYSPIKDSVPSGGCFLLGYQGKLYQIHSDFQVSETSSKFDTCGCGEDYAKGAMEVLDKQDLGLTAKTKIFKALAVAEKFSIGVSGPFNIISL